MPLPSLQPKPGTWRVVVFRLFFVGWQGLTVWTNWIWKVMQQKLRQQNHGGNMLKCLKTVKCWRVRQENPTHTVERWNYLNRWLQVKGEFPTYFQSEKGMDPPSKMEAIVEYVTVCCFRLDVPPFLILRFHFVDFFKNTWRTSKHFCIQLLFLRSMKSVQNLCFGLGLQRVFVLTSNF